MAKDGWISTGILAKKEIEEADKCELQKLISGICERCRDKAYCYRQRTLFDYAEEK